MQKSILDFFVKPPHIPTTKEEVKKPKNASNSKNKTNDSNINNINENETISKSYKRLIPISDDENDGKENAQSSPQTKKIKTANESNKNSTSLHTSPIVKKNVNKPVTPLSKNNKSFSDLNESQSVDIEETHNVESYDHFSFEFLKENAIMDSKRRRPDHPMYDSSTLFVPGDFMAKVTPAMKQWWQMKINGMNDTLLFFKVGKFYELYHMDAVIAVNELSLTFMRGNYAHCGFPEIAFTKMSDQLVQKGYKVSRVEQTETVDAMTERCIGRPSKDKVVNREACQVVTPGTRTFSLRNGATRVVAQEEAEDITFDDNVGAILYSLKEAPIENYSRNKSRFTVDIGVALVNTNTGKFMLAQFADDKLRSKLRTMLSRFQPNEIIYERGELSKDTQHLLSTSLASVRKEGLNKPKQFLSAEDALARLLEGGYFTDTPKDRLSRFGLPLGITEALNEGDNLGRSPGSNYTLAINCLGGLIYYLEKCLIDKYLISLADFVIYHPTDETKSELSQPTRTEPFYKFQSNMILDCNALQNLDLLRNGSTGGIEGTLLERLDFTSTSFGKRLLLQWIATPLCNPISIIDRQDAVTELMELESRLGPVRQKLKSLPDLEKLLTRIHAVGLTKSVADHPDSRAVLYENIRYSRRKIIDFIATINAFNTVISIQSYFGTFHSERKLRSNLLKTLILRKQDHKLGSFPDLESKVKDLQESFDHDKAKAEGKITPAEGKDQVYEEAMEGIKMVQAALDRYLLDQGKLLNCQISFFGTGRNRFQLEIPESKSNRVPRTYVASSQRKNFKRYTTSETESLLSEMMSAEDKRDAAIQNIMSRMFAHFDEDYPWWTQAINCLAQLDVLMSFSVFSRGVDGGPMTKPDVVELASNVKPFLIITEGRYPLKAVTQTGEFISNTIVLGNDPGSDAYKEDKRAMILTGPNMGGKSTLMRQAALIIILSQLGCYVPAEGPVTMTPVDRLLTRQGASDSISSGQSTLQVELNEMASIMAYMTSHSFLIIDELGRGTATHDGCALACSILTSIVRGCEPRTIFSTHFHKLLDEISLIEKVQLCHMACMVEDDSDETKLQNITFLYKLTAGSCPKSYGFNVARLAGIPEKIILSGLNKSKLFEEETLVSEFKRLLCSGDKLPTDLVKEWQSKFKMLYRR